MILLKAHHFYYIFIVSHLFWGRNKLLAEGRVLMRNAKHHRRICTAVPLLSEADRNGPRSHNFLWNLSFCCCGIGTLVIDIASWQKWCCSFSWHGQWTAVSTSFAWRSCTGYLTFSDDTNRTLLAEITLLCINNLNIFHQVASNSGVQG